MIGSNFLKLYSILIDRLDKNVQQIEQALLHKNRLSKDKIMSIYLFVSKKKQDHSIMMLKRLEGFLL